MANPIIIGTMALDNIETPFGKAVNTLGGSASYASIAASFFTKPGAVSIIGKDFPQEHIDFLKKRDIDMEGVIEGDKTFRWDGFYEYDMNVAQTRKTELNSLETFQPVIPEAYKKADHVFLGNITPKLQLQLLESMKKPKLSVVDTMNLWIDIAKDDLLEVIKKADVLVCNDGEARQLFGTTNLVQAAKKAIDLTSKAVVIKKGEHGALLFCDGKHFSAPGFPLETIKDPTGCGDCFGGAFTAYLAKTSNHSEENLRKAVVYGSVIASFNAEDFSCNRLKTLTMEEIEERYQTMKDIRSF